MAKQFSINQQQIDLEDTFAILVTQLVKEFYPQCKIYTFLNQFDNINWPYWYFNFFFTVLSDLYIKHITIHKINLIKYNLFKCIN